MALEFTDELREKIRAEIQNVEITLDIKKTVIYFAFGEGCGSFRGLRAACGILAQVSGCSDNFSGYCGSLRDDREIFGDRMQAFGMIVRILGVIARIFGVFRRISGVLLHVSGRSGSFSG